MALNSAAAIQMRLYGSAGDHSAGMRIGIRHPSPSQNPRWITSAGLPSMSHESYRGRHFQQHHYREPNPYARSATETYLSQKVTAGTSDPAFLPRMPAEMYASQEKMIVQNNLAEMARMASEMYMSHESIGSHSDPMFPARVPANVPMSQELNSMRIQHMIETRAQEIVQDAVKELRGRCARRAAETRAKLDNLIDIVADVAAVCRRQQIPSAAVLTMEVDALRQRVLVLESHVSSITSMMFEDGAAM